MRLQRPATWRSGTPRTELKPVMVNPGPADLPIYVRAGTILPMAPLVQSTDEKPSGALTLRVFPGDECEGSIYQDDGQTFDFRKGVYFRQRFTCRLSPEGVVTVDLGVPEGTYRPWWTSVRVEVVAFHSTQQDAQVDGRSVPVEHSSSGVAVTFPLRAGGQRVVVR